MSATLNCRKTYKNAQDLPSSSPDCINTAFVGDMSMIGTEHAPNRWRSRNPTRGNGRIQSSGN